MKFLQYMLVTSRYVAFNFHGETVLRIGCFEGGGLV